MNNQVLTEVTEFSGTVDTLHWPKLFDIFPKLKIFELHLPKFTNAMDALQAVANMETPLGEMVCEFLTNHRMDRELCTFQFLLRFRLLIGQQSLQNQVKAQFPNCQFTVHVINEEEEEELLPDAMITPNHLRFEIGNACFSVDSRKSKSKGWWGYFQCSCETGYDNYN